MTEWNRSVSDASRNVGMLEFHATKRIWLYKWFQSFSIQVQKTSVGNHPIPRLGRRQPPCTMNPTGTHVCSYLSLWLHQPWIFDMPIIMSWHVMSCTVMWCDAMVCLYVRTYVCMSSIYMWYIYIYGPVSRVPTPPPWDGGGTMPLWWCIYIPTYLHTYVHTYIPLHYLTLHYLTLPYLTFHTYIPTYIHTYHTLHYLTNIPTYQHTTTTGHRGGTRRTIPPPQATGGGDQKNHTTTTGHRGGGRRTRRYCPPIPIGGGGRGGGQRCTIYIYICNAWALPQRCSVEGSHSQSNVAATLHSIGKINKGIREY